jgi:hypothetical protein
MTNKENIARPYLPAGFMLLIASVPSLAQYTQKEFAATYTAIPPLIDGDIGDAIWKDAVLIDDFHEVEPNEYSPAKEEVFVRVLYDEDHLYISVEILMRDMDDITAFRLAQGSDIQEEDRFKVIIDPYNNQRSGYDFRINPNGVREEGLFGLLGRPNTDWNGIWDGRARITETGWTAEMSIPFKTLNFDPANSTWGISFSNQVQAHNEQIAWTSQSKLVRPGTLGVMTGIERAKQGRGLDIVPSLSLQAHRDHATGTDEIETEPSIDIFYKLTPLLTAALTINTDFSAAEVDDRVVNLERFPVFFPEKRAFFLQDADIFAFAGLEENGIPFFSRRIGIDDNRQPVDLIGGVKLTGRVGPLNVGILDVVQESETDNVNLLVSRGFINVLNLSTLGFIFTNGSPDPDVSNSVAGLDFNYINRDLFGNAGLLASAWYLQSETRGIQSSQEAYGFIAETSRTGGPFTELRHQRLGRNYYPALGFVNRAGIVDNEVEVGYRWLPGNSWIQAYDVILETKWITDLDGNTESEEIVFEPVNLVTNNNDRIELKLYREREVLVSPFEISDGVVIEPGDYSWNKAELVVATGEQRRLVADVTIADGDFYDGDRLEIAGNLIWQPSKYFALRGGIEYNDVDLANGAFIARLITMRADISFSSTWSWNTLAQYDNESDELSINSRLRWIPRGGQELIFVVNHGYLVDESLPEPRRVWRSLESDIVLKAHYTFRY